jgi:hypothetical protein
MSSSAYLTFVEPISLQDWMLFCEEHDIRYRPNTIGQSTFYGGSTQITATPEGTLQHDENGMPIWSTATPPSVISELTVSTFFHGDLDSVGATINAIAERFPCSASSAPELSHLLVDVPQTHEIDELNDFISTDFVEGWTFLDDIYTAKVPAGNAMISKSNTHWTATISGVKRGTFVDLNHAFAFAGRASWDWWYGSRPDKQAELRALPHK